MVDFAGTHGSVKASDRPVFVVRIGTAIVQAAALYLLTEAVGPPATWPATDAAIFTPLFMVALLIPVMLLVGLGQIQAGKLVKWAVAAAVVVAGLGYYDAVRGQVADHPDTSILLLLARVTFAAATGLFIAHTIVVDAVIEGRLLAPYPRHFDTILKQGVQGILSVAFVGVFWGVLGLGAALFRLLDVDFFQGLLAHSWFAYPATTLAMAVSIHLTDVQPALIRGVRSVALTLVSWLLPLLAAIMAAFLGSLPFISLAPLWKTHFATGLLLAASGLLIVLINCCYQDGGAEAARSRIKRVATMIAAVELLPLVGLAAWALALRVGQYGWSVQRIFAAAVVVVAASVAVGYASAVVRSAVWMKRIEITNVLAAYAVIGGILALFSPVADPARLMVADQINRLKSGAIRPDAFDFVALKFDGARWGTAALIELGQIKDIPDADLINRRAVRTASLVNRYAAPQPGAKPEDIAAHILVYPAGHPLPASFLDGSLWPETRTGMPSCLQPPMPKCIVRFVAAQPGAAEAMLFIGPGEGFLLEQDAQGTWRRTATVSGAVFCDTVRQGLAGADVKVEPHAWPDFTVGEQRLVILPLSVPCRPVSR